MIGSSEVIPDQDDLYSSPRLRCQLVLNEHSSIFDTVRVGRIQGGPLSCVHYKIQVYFTGFLSRIL